MTYKCKGLFGVLLALAAVVGFLFLRPILAEGKEEKVDSQAVRDEYEKGREFFHQKDYPKAKRAFERVLSQNPDHASANRYLGRVYLEAEQDYRKAIRYLEKAVTLSSGSFKRDPTYYLAKAYEGAGDYRKALSTWENYLKYVDPESKRETEARQRIAELKSRLQQ